MDHNAAVRFSHIWSTGKAYKIATALGENEIMPTFAARNDSPGEMRSRDLELRLDVLVVLTDPKQAEIGDLVDLNAFFVHESAIQPEEDNEINDPNVEKIAKFERGPHAWTRIE